MRFRLVALLALSLHLTAHAQITSTNAGGDWSEPSTWLGGSVPTDADDVVVAGPVVVRTGDACRHLIIEPAGSLTDAVGASFTDVLVAEGDVVNRGSIQFGPSQLRIHVRGDLQNEGTWRATSTVLDGEQDQTITLPGNAALTGAISVSKDSGVLDAASELRFTDGNIDLNGHRLEMSGFAITTDDSFFLDDGTVVGPVALRGVMQSRSTGLVLEGDITVEGILEDAPGGSFTDVLSVRGRIVNQGTVRNATSQFRIVVDGEVHNAGTWNITETRFDGQMEQRLSHEPGRVLGGGWSTSGESVTVAAGSDLVFSSANVNLGGGTLRLETFDLHLTDASTFRDGRLDTRSLSLEGGSTIGGTLTVAPNVTLHGTVQVFGGTVFEGAVVVADSLRDAPAGSFTETMEVHGRLRNEGVIEGNLNIVATSDLVNVGAWTNSATYLSGTTVQSLSVEDEAPFGGGFIVENESGAIVAASDLHFAAGSMDLQSRRLEMGGHALTTDETFLFDDGIVAGPVALRGRMQGRSSGLILEGDVIVEGILEGYAGGSFTDFITVRGRLENRGVIQNGTSQFRIELDGQAHNAGTWSITETRFIGTEDQRISHEPGSPLSGGWTLQSDTLTVDANSGLAFSDASVDLNGGLLRMTDFDLVVNNASRLQDGRLDADVLEMSGNATLGGGLRITSGVTLRGAVQVFSGTVFEGTVTVADTLRDAPGGSFIETTEILQHLRNDGVIDGNLYLRVGGDLTNSGAWANSRTYMDGSGRRTIRGKTIESPLYISGDDVILTGTVDLERLFIDADGSARVSGEGFLRLPVGGLSGNADQITNFGRVIMHDELTVGRTATFFDAVLRMPGEHPEDSVFVETYGHQAPETFGGAVQNWWRLGTSNGSAATFPSITFRYADDQLASNDESDLKVFHSADSGATWAQISTSANTTFDPDDNEVTVENVTAGDFVVSSEADPYSVVPNIIVSITGRNNIRVGAPSRYEVHYVNASSRPTADLLLALNLDLGGRFLRIEPSGSADAEYSRDDFAFASVEEDTLVVLSIAAMDPGEERSLVVVAEADASAAGKNNQAVISLTITVVGAAGLGLAVSYVLDGATSSCEEWLVNDRDWQEALQVGAERTYDRWFGSLEVPTEALIQNTINALIEKGLALPGNAISLAQSAASCAGSFFTAAKRFIEPYTPAAYVRRQCAGTPLEKNGTQNDDPWAGSTCQVPVTGGTRVDFEVVRSWDPNEKLGPSGIDGSGFITKLARTHYTILFENKAEATAAAYRIVITDTLSDNFDPTTVEFTGESHDGFAATRDGDILRWEIEGIELPPNVEPPEGEGFVSFAVDPRAALESGTVLENRATIVFDANPPILTNAVVNTLDTSAPVTTMTSIVPRTSDNEALITWASEDGDTGSGPAIYNLFSSYEGGPFTLAATTTQDSVAVPIEAEGSYSFYALATDRVGNAEARLPAALSAKFTPVSTAPDETPRRFRLAQNYPNPFNPSTTLTYEVASPSRIHIVVYDVLGREIAVLADAERATGTHSLVWEAQGMASGVYFVRMHAEAVGSGRVVFNAVRTMVLLR